MKTFGILMIVLALGMSGCAPKPRPQTQDEPLELHYQPSPGQGLEGRAIGVTVADSKIASLNPAIRVRTETQWTYAGAVSDGIRDIVMARGGHILGPYERYEDIPYGDKERMMLFIVPRIRITLAARFDDDRGRSGSFVGHAEGLLRFIEPLTREVVFTRHIAADRELAFGRGEDPARKLRQTLSDLYEALMRSAEGAIDPAEFAAHEAEIEKLKSLKRF